MGWRCARAAVLDVGCGPGQWLLRILERCDVRGVGVDRSAPALARARAEAALVSDQREGYLRGYRGTLGYVTVLLGAPIQ